MSTLIDVQEVATDGDLETEITKKEFCRLAGDDTEAGKDARQLALDDILYQLANRVPPIQEGDLAFITELKIATVYGAVARMYRNRITTGDNDDVNFTKSKLYQKLFDSRSGQLRPQVSNQQLAGPSSITVHRR